MKPCLLGPYILESDKYLRRRTPQRAFGNTARLLGALLKAKAHAQGLDGVQTCNIRIAWGLSRDKSQPHPRIAASNFCGGP
jgi:hypothetical protein